MRKISIFYLFYLLGFLTLFTFVFRSVLLNISTNLIDWRDYTFITWLINRNIDRVTTLKFSGFYNLNILFPHVNTIFFSELLITQTLMGIPVRLFTSNPITTFNIVFVVTFLLNYLSLYFFWQKLFSRDLLSFMGSIFVIFSPFFFLSIGHFQMFSYWPFFYALLYLIKYYEKRYLRFLLLSGFFCGLQFLASVYLGVFLLYTIFLFIFIKLLFERNIKIFLTALSIIIISFISLTGLFIKGYYDTKKQYSIVRNPNEFIQYSAHVSDYLFTTPVNSLLHTSSIINLWNKFDKNTIGGKAAFPGFTLLLLALPSIFKLRISKKSVGVNSLFNPQDIFFLLLALSGLVFSWGPRINFNGTYASIPAPYYLFLKFIPFLESTRAPARWSFIFYLGIVYFAVKTINRLLNQKKVYLVITIILIAFLVEYIPKRITTHGESYNDPQYVILTSYCSRQKTSLLEVPITHFDGNGGILNGLNRVVKYELSSLIHKCHLINGYTGYDFPPLLSFKDSFYTTLSKKHDEKFIDLLTKNKVDIVKINRDNMSEEDLDNYLYLYPLLLKNKNIQIIGENLWLINLSLKRQ